MAAIGDSSEDATVETLGFRGKATGVEVPREREACQHCLDVIADLPWSEIYKYSRPEVMITRKTRESSIRLLMKSHMVYICLARPSDFTYRVQGLPR
jgi:hypothetical protein